MNLKTLVVFFVLSLTQTNDLWSATCKSNGSGDWGTNSTWSCGHVPTCGDSVVIQAGHTLTISSQQDLRGCGSNLVLAIYGTLKFLTGNKLRLACNSRVYVFTGGSLVPGGGGGSSNELEICGVTLWQASDGIYNGPGCFPSTLTACAKVLPIELVIFETIDCAGDDKVCLHWQTASEHNNDYFKVEQSSDGVQFETLDKVRSKAAGGNSQETLDYFVSYKLNSNTRFYYRLTQVDYDKSSTQSNIIALQTSGDAKVHISIFPNPNSGIFFYRVTGSELPVQLEIRELSGRIIYTGRSVSGSSEDSENINLGHQVTEGFYFCSILIGDKVYHQKILVQK